MKALGASSFFVFRQGLVQALAISIVGVAISVPVAWVTEIGLTALSNDIPISFRTDTFVTTSVSLLVAAAIGALFSVRQVIRVDPIIALGQQQ
ncbi:MAG: FtsX-like permease family protein [Dehalococcoidia bacterium]|nr:FtsX-like permease family protein [Dehalococcoidia bacterium]